MIPGRTVDEVRAYAREGLAVCRKKGNPDAGKFFAATLDVLSDPNTKRLVLDARQAAVLGESGDVPGFVQEKLRMPFHQFYVELTEPVQLGEPQDGYTDYVTAFYAMPNGTHLGRDVYLLAFFFQTVHENGAVEMGDHEFTFDVATGACLVTKNACLHRWELYRESLSDSRDASGLPDDWDGMRVFEAGSFIEGMPVRRIGWWERYVLSMGDFFSWFLSYTMAKSVRIVRLSPSNGQDRSKPKKKRAKGRIPMAWHAVTVEPSFAQATGPGGADSGREHAYRYDVIGHLRFGRHKCKDGSYTRSIEWVAPHQRGLKHSHYVPKTYRVKSGRVASSKMREYYEGT